MGGRKVGQLKENIAALEIFLTAEQIKRIEEATPIDPGFLQSMFFLSSLLTCDRPVR